ncbi:class I SAM-dependent methyltransferase [Ilumatobacter sp.]|uniref:class I SAM-dependent methyltransferase n=1 Tax=Ilumatobacter sp. TaxID=1967498 RepID=UPI003C435842
MTDTPIERVALRVRLGDDDIWRADDESDVSYPASGHSSCLAVEESSFWFNHRNDCIRELVQAFPPTPGKPMLDVGGGNGYVSLGLARSGLDVILIEPGESGARNAKRRGLAHVICGTTETARIRPGSIGAIGLFDVIEHIADDTAFLVEMHSLLTTGDSVYATVPAYQRLWSADDERAGHHRRYSCAEISSLFDAAGFEIDYAGYFFRPLPAAVLLFRTIPYRIRRALGRSGSNERATDMPDADETARAGAAARSHGANARSLSTAVRTLLRPELTNIAKRRRMRFGGSILVAAHRR